MTTVEVLAPAKINLTLHVTGRRPDGYHVLDSLVAFGEVGDVITVEPSEKLSLEISGPFAEGLSHKDNLVLDAARLMGGQVRIHLDKRLPVAAGIGGGSADAAATILACSRLTGGPFPEAEALMQLGADVPACMENGLLRMSGAGERVNRLGAMPTLPMVLVNPGVAVPTPSVFAALQVKENAAMDDTIPDTDAELFLDWLAEQRNDLESPACEIAPIIKDVLDTLGKTDGAAVVRMSGSGATCFAIYRGKQDARAAQMTLKAAYPDWWVAGSGLS